jgi:hypothetical protein
LGQVGRRNLRSTYGSKRNFATSPKRARPSHYSAEIAEMILERGPRQWHPIRFRIVDSGCCAAAYFAGLPHVTYAHVWLWHRGSMAQHRDSCGTSPHLFMVLSARSATASPVDPERLASSSVRWSVSGVAWCAAVASVRAFTSRWGGQACAPAGVPRQLSDHGRGFPPARGHAPGRWAACRTLSAA